MNKKNCPKKALRNAMIASGLCVGTIQSKHYILGGLFERSKLRFADWLTVMLLKVGLFLAIQTLCFRFSELYLWIEAELSISSVNMVKILIRWYKNTRIELQFVPLTP